MSKCVIISAIDHVNRRTKTVVKGDATSSTLTSFTTKQEAMTANGSQHTYGHRGARWELFISTSVPGVCVGGKLDRVCRWLLTKPPSALVTCGADQRDEATAVSCLFGCVFWTCRRQESDWWGASQRPDELRRKSNDHTSHEVTIISSNFINAIHASRPPNAFNMFSIMIVSQLKSQLQKQ